MSSAKESLDDTEFATHVSAGEPKERQAGELLDTTPELDSKRHQFSLRRMLTIMTVICGVCAFPSGFVILLSLTGWLGVALAILAVLMLLQFPLMFAVKRWAEEQEESQGKRE